MRCGRPSEKSIVLQIVAALQDGTGLQMQLQVGAQSQQACPVDPAPGEGDPATASGAAGIDGGLDGGSIVVAAVACGTEGQNIILHKRHSLKHDCI